MYHLNEIDLDSLRKWDFRRAKRLQPESKIRVAALREVALILGHDEEHAKAYAVAAFEMVSRHLGNAGVIRHKFTRSKFAIPELYDKLMQGYTPKEVTPNEHTCRSIDAWQRLAGCELGPAVVQRFTTGWGHEYGMSRGQTPLPAKGRELFIRELGSFDVQWAVRASLGESIVYGSMPVAETVQQIGYAKALGIPRDSDKAETRGIISVHMLMYAHSTWRRWIYDNRHNFRKAGYAFVHELEQMCPRTYIHTGREPLPPPRSWEQFVAMCGERIQRQQEEVDRRAAQVIAENKGLEVDYPYAGRSIKAVVPDEEVTGRTVAEHPAYGRIGTEYTFEVIPNYIRQVEIGKELKNCCGGINYGRSCVRGDVALVTVSRGTKLVGMCEVVLTNWQVGRVGEQWRAEVAGAEWQDEIGTPASGLKPDIAMVRQCVLSCNKQMPPLLEAATKQIAKQLVPKHKDCDREYDPGRYPGT
jgi:hypothetical protein